MNSTIFAISTPSGIGGIATIRISGPEAIAVCDSLFLPVRQSHQLSSRPSHTLTFGQIIDPATKEPLDEVVVAIYRAPHSFTGEEVVEITCHGSLYIQQQLIQILSSLSSKFPALHMAEPGEFTRRAFANGRMDLSQAEAVADLISAQNAASHRLALNQMKGSFSRKLDTLHDQLLQLSSLLELELDFSEEDVVFADRTQLLSIAHQIDAELIRLSDTFRTGQAIRNGIPVAIIGETNAGKSTLLNQLLGDDKALVSDVHGTTRDVIEDTVLLSGRLIRFIDTAGIRDTSDRVEYMGIERTYQRLSRAQVVLWMIDGTRLGDAVQAEDCRQDALQIFNRIAPHLTDNQQIVVVINKVDLVSADRLSTYLPKFQEALLAAFTTCTPRFVSISAKFEQGLDQLRQLLLDATNQPEISSSDVILTNQRHYQAMQEAHLALQHVIDGLNHQISGDLVAEDLHQVIDALNSILGRSITSQDTLNNIFKNFCIGK